MFLNDSPGPVEVRQGRNYDLYGHYSCENGPRRYLIKVTECDKTRPGLDTKGEIILTTLIMTDYENDIDEMRKWVDDNCQERVVDMELKHEEGIGWFFESEEDIVLFRLRWGGNV